MRILILGGTLFIGRRIARELLARGDDVMVVHRGQTEPAELSGCAHVHAARSALAGVAGRLRAGARPGGQRRGRRVSCSSRFCRKLTGRLLNVAVAWLFRKDRHSLGTKEGSASDCN